MIAMSFVLRCMVLFRLAEAHNSVGAAAQWLRQDGPITRTTRGGAEALTVIDSFATARTVYVLGTAVGRGTYGKYRSRPRPSRRTASTVVA